MNIRRQSGCARGRKGAHILLKHANVEVHNLVAQHLQQHPVSFTDTSCYTGAAHESNIVQTYVKANLCASEARQKTCQAAFAAKGWLKVKVQSF